MDTTQKDEVFDSYILTTQGVVPIVKLYTINFDCDQHKYHEKRFLQYLEEKDQLYNVCT